MNRLIDSPEAIGGKRRQGQASLRECAGKRLKKQKQKHLYLVLDDWSKGFFLVVTGRSKAPT
jgi:hypothetical protein